MKRTVSSPQTGNSLPLLDGAERLILNLCRCIGPTWRYVITGDDGDGVPDEQPALYCFRHEYLLPIYFYYRHSGVRTVVSRSRDGSRLSNVLSHLGIIPVRGSSSRGGMAVIRQCVRLLGQGERILMTPDGPRGPRGIAKPGAAQIARMGAVPVVVMAAHCPWSVRLTSWDRGCIPLPFARIELRYQPPIIFDTGHDTPETFTARLQREMDICR